MAEILLQKTQVSKVEKAFAQLYKEFPTIESLSSADHRDLEDLFSWLGLVKRARYLLEAATIISTEHNGKIPDDANELLKLPGIGDYSANAILCFGYGQAKEIVDSTIARVLRRVFGYSTEKRAWEDKVTWQLAKELIDITNPIEYNYALLDLASLVCLSNNPSCKNCPVLKWCEYAKSVN